MFLVLCHFRRLCVCVSLFAGVVNEQLKDFKDSGRFKETDDNLAIFTIKERAIEVIDLVFNFRFYVRLQVRISWLPQHTLVTDFLLILQRFIFDYRVLRGDTRPQPAITHSSQQPPILLHSLLTESDKKKLLQNPV